MSVAQKKAADRSRKIADRGKRIVGVEGVGEYLGGATKWQVYTWTRDPVNPLPHRKCGKRLLFDLDVVDQWFDSLPGKDFVSLGDF